MLELLREVKVEEFVENFKSKELCEILEATIEFNNYRNYYNIDKMGNVKTKSPNEALVKLSLLGNECLGEYFQNRVNANIVTQHLKSLSNTCGLSPIRFFKNYMIYYLTKNSSIIGFYFSTGFIKFSIQSIYSLKS